MCQGQRGNPFNSCCSFKLFQAEKHYYHHVCIIVTGSTAVAALTHEHKFTSMSRHKRTNSHTPLQFSQAPLSAVQPPLGYLVGYF